MNAMWSQREHNPETCQTSKMERFAQIVNCFKRLSTLAKCSILDVCHVSKGSEYASFS